MSDSASATTDLAGKTIDLFTVLKFFGQALANMFDPSSLQIRHLALQNKNIQKL